MSVSFYEEQKLCPLLN